MPEMQTEVTEAKKINRFHAKLRKQAHLKSSKLLQEKFWKKLFSVAIISSHNR